MKKSATLFRYLVLAAFASALGAQAQAPSPPPAEATAPAAATPATSAPPAATTPAPVAAPEPPPIPKHREIHHGVAVDDPFRSLEDAADPATAAFFREQAAKARTALDALPGRAELLARIRALSEGNTAITSLTLSANRVFFLRQAPGQMTPRLVMRDGINGPDRVLIDPERFANGGARAAIDWFVPSPDARYVAYGISRGGSEDSALRVLATDTAKDLPIEIDRARFNTRLEWHPDSRSFYYARVPEGNTGARRNANIRLYRHVIGRDTAKDEIVFAPGVGGARDVPEFVYPSLHLPLESRFAYAIARDGVRREIAVHVALQRDLASGKPRWRKLVGIADDVTAIEGWKDDLYLLSHRNAPRFRILRVKGDAADLNAARVIVPQGDVVIDSMGLARDALYLRMMVGGVHRLERVPIGLLGTRAPEFLRIPFDNAITQLVTHPRRPGALLRMQGNIDAPVVYELDSRRGDLRNTGIQPPARADFSEMDEVRLYAPGHDGTKIPVTLIYKKTTQLSGNNPTLLVGYGSYGITLAPAFDPMRLAWLERGGVYAIAHVRGGGEYGKAWHEDGQKARKVNTILDFIAVSEFLVRYGFTNPKRLAIMGTSAGGIPAGGALVRKPELFAAVVARVPVMDMLRFEFAQNGPANIPEFGSIATAPGFEALHAMSAYHHVKDGTAYPAVLLTAGMNDPRVDPWQPGKMAARLQAASTSGKPVLLRIDFDSGHGRGTQRTQREEELADIYSFLLWQFGDPKFQVPRLPEPTPLAPSTPPPAGAAPPAAEPAAVPK
jgi:prolyl oligopeptidase